MGKCNKRPTPVGIGMQPMQPMTMQPIQPMQPQTMQPMQPQPMQFQSPPVDMLTI